MPEHSCTSHAGEESAIPRLPGLTELLRGRGREQALNGRLLHAAPKRNALETVFGQSTGISRKDLRQVRTDPILAVAP